MSAKPRRDRGARAAGANGGRDQGESGGDVRARVHQAAIDLFSEKGFDATSVREIVARAGVSKPALYYYYDSKEALGREILVETGQAYQEALARAAAGTGDLTDAVATLICDHFRFTGGHMKTLRFMFETTFGDKARSFQAEALAIGQSVLEQTMGTVRGVAEKRGMDPERSQALAEAVTTVMRSEIMMRVAGIGEQLTQERARRIARYLVAGAVHLNDEEE